MKCPRCSGLLMRENGHVHCLGCARDFRLVPFRGETKRLELVNSSRQYDVALTSHFAGVRLPNQKIV